MVASLIRRLIRRPAPPSPAEPRPEDAARAPARDGAPSSPGGDITANYTIRTKRPGETTLEVSVAAGEDDTLEVARLLTRGAGPGASSSVYCGAPEGGEPLCHYWASPPGPEDGPPTLPNPPRSG